jgi:plasmid stability protein
MPTLTIRNLDQEVVDRLKAKAKENGRSLEAEAREILQNEARQLTGREARELVDRIAAMTPKGVKQTDSTKIIREFRDR